MKLMEKDKKELKSVQISIMIKILVLDLIKGIIPQIFKPALRI